MSCLVLIGCCFSNSVDLRAQQPHVPYQALVVTENARVYSGPGDMHYATQELQQGELVNVYRHDPGGWCAIRPPQGSLSLVPESAIKIVEQGLGELGEQGVGEVVESNVQAWVGTDLGAVEKPLWQVKLKAGEQVYLLGEITWPDPDGNEMVWYQISPPNGEFRWIHLDDIQLPASELPEEFEVDAGRTSQPNRPTRAAGEPAERAPNNEGWRPAKEPFQKQSDIQLMSGEEEFELPDYQVQQATPAGVFDEEPNENGFVTPSVNRQRLADASSGSDIGPIPFDPNRDRIVQNQTQRPDRYASADASFGKRPATQPMNAIRPLGSVRLSNRLRELDLRLSDEVIKPTSQWELRNIAMDVQSIVSRPANSMESAAAQRLLNKINNFLRIQSNARAVEAQRSADGSPLNSGAVGSGVATQQSSTIYDAQGWLNELTLQRGTVDPTYVLQNENGKITHHVQGAPGLNLRRYLKAKVGIMGQRGFHQGYNLNHVLAERLIVLEKPRRR